MLSRANAAIKGATSARNRAREAGGARARDLAWKSSSGSDSIIRQPILPSALFVDRRWTKLCELHGCSLDETFECRRPRVGQASNPDRVSLPTPCCLFHALRTPE